MIALGLLIACASGPEVAVETGFSGASFRSAWGRSTVVVTNDGTARDAVLRLTLRGGLEPVVYRREVALAPRARKRISIDCFLLGYELEAEAVLTDLEGRPLARGATPFRFLDERERQILVVGDSIPPSLRDVETTFSIAIAVVKADRFPDTAPSLRAADAIVVLEPIRLEVAQEEALLRWLVSGGRLFYTLGRGTGLLPPGVWRELCPIEVTETRTIVVPGRDGPIPLPMSSGPARSGTTTLHSTAGQPSLFRASKGAGRIDFACFPLDLPGIDQVVPPEQLWRTVLAVPPKEEELPGRREEEPRVYHRDTETVASALSPQGEYVHLPSLAWGALPLLAYVAFIGPLDFFRLRKQARLRKGWLSFGVALILCTGFSLAWGAFLSPRQARLANVVLADEGWIETVSVYRAGEGGRLALSGAGALSPLGTFGRFAATEDDDAPVVDEPARLSASIPPLATRSILSSRAPAAGELGVTCRWREGGRILEVANVGPLPLRECRLVTLGGFTPLGELGAGETREFERASLREVPMAAWVEKMFGERRTSGRGRRSILEEAAPEFQALAITFYERLHRVLPARRADTYRLAQRGLDLTPFLDRGRAVFVGSFERDLSGLAADPSVQVQSRGLLRAVVEEGP